MMKLHIVLLTVALAVVLVALLPAMRRHARAATDLIDTAALDTFARLFPHTPLMADGVTVEQQDRLLELNEEAETLQATADAEKRDLTEEEQGKVDSIFAEFKKVEGDIARRERIEAQGKKLAERMGRRTDPNDTVLEDPEDPTAQRRNALQRANPGLQPRIPARDMRDPNGTRWGWQSLGHFALAVRSASRGGGHVDPRLVQNAPTTFQQEGVGADGGFLVPPEFRQAILQKVQAEDALLSRTDQLTSSSNTLILPADETTPWDTNTGVLAFWEGEGNQLTQSKAQFKSKTHRLNKLTALVPVTEEQLDDAPATDTYLRRKVPEKFTSKINTAIVRGTGAGMPFGILESPALVTVAKEAGQSADTIVMENVKIGRAHV